MSAFTLADDQTVEFTLAVQDDAGNPVAEALTSPSWSESSAGATLTVVPSADGTTAVVTAVGPLGVATVTVTASQPDGSQITGSVDITVGPGTVSAIELVPGTPTHK